MDLDRQAVERRDFPIARRGYDPAAVDAHLRALAVEIEELQRAAASPGAEASLASSAGSQVQSILAAAESAAAEIESQARDAARRTREDADRDAQQTRQEAIEKARAHVAAVAQVAATLLERVGGMDTEVRALIDSLRGGATRLASDLAAVDANMGELYDAAAGHAHTDAVAVPAPSLEPPPPPPDLPSPPIARTPTPPQAAAAPQAATPPQAAAPPPAPVPAAGTGDGAAQNDAGAASTAPGDADLDGARLIALNMALNGDSRADTDRYLAENFELSDRGALVDEVYAAIEG